MKNKIKQFSKGDFRMPYPDIVFPETHIMITAGEGEVSRGSFRIENRNQENIRGLVYPSSPRIHCIEQGFEGNPIEVNFIYDASGLLPGYVDTGKFTVMCNGGEYELCFTAVIEKQFLMTSCGKLQNLEDFKRVAAHDFSEATRIFRSRQFADILKYEEERIKNLYENMRKWSLDEQALEEFLVGIQKKEKIFLMLSDEEIEFEHVTDTQKDFVEITKNTWGYLPIHMRAEGDFIHIRQEMITTDDFVGNHYRMEYLIRKKKLHAGCNYGKILIETPYETLSVNVNVYQFTKTRDDSRRERELIEAQALKQYLSCISGRMEREEWLEKALETAKQLRSMELDNEYFYLLQAHIYLLWKKEKEARWILDNYNYNRFAVGKKPEINAYYLFLTALMQKDTVYTGRMLEELNRLYNKFPHSWKILCMILHLDSKYKDCTERMRMLERQFFAGANQLLFYAEAYRCVQQRVTLLRKLGSFEIQVLNFASKYKMVTRELALYVAELISQQRVYDRRLYYILERLYQSYKEPQILNAVCIQLIRGHKTDSAYFKWYEQAVEQELKITQLYEYYMMSIHGKQQRPLPKIVCLYFMHGNTLDYRKTAFLYANILQYEEKDSDLYQHYQEEIKAFAWKHLLERHINEDFRVIYNHCLTQSEMTPECLDALYDICHAYHIKTPNKYMRYVLVIDSDGMLRQRTAYKEEGVILYLYDKDARIVWEGNDGVHYTDSIPYDAKRMFYEIRFLEMCKNRMTDRGTFEKEKQFLPLTWKNLRLYGVHAFDEEEVFLFCTKRIREGAYMEDDFLIHLCFEVLKSGFYDKVLLTYLAKFYCGATRNMKIVWKKARELSVPTHSLSERIITQMLFAEVMFQEEEIFADYYYGGKPYFRLKQAYLAYVAKEFLLNNRQTDGRIFVIMMQEYEQKETLADVCKAALLKYYADSGYGQREAELLREFLRELCEKGMVFAFYLSYPESWLKEVQLHDKVIVEYHAEKGNRVKIVYQIYQGDMEGLDYESEVLRPVYGTIYAKEFILYKGERVKYYFKETQEQKKIMTGKEVIEQKKPASSEGKYGRLSQIMEMKGTEQKQAMAEYQQEEEIAEQLFLAY